MSPFLQALKKVPSHKSGMLGLVITLTFIFLAAFADLIVAVDPYSQDLSQKFIPPIWDAAAQWPHILGTDILGRDVLSRLIYGTRLSLLIGVISVGVGILLGVPLGLWAGYAGGKWDALIMRCVDVMLACPSLLLAVCIVAILGPSLENAMIALGIVAIPKYIRVVRASVLSEKEKEYIQSDISLGRPHYKILFLGILPNILSPILVISSLEFAGAVLEAAGLSFLGLGAQPPTPEWGALLYEGKKYVFTAWWLILFPGIAIMLTVLGFNLLGDALRDVFDPKS